MAALTALTARKHAMAASASAAANVSPGVAPLKQSMMAQITRQVDEASARGDLDHTCICNLPAPGPIEQLRYPGTLTLRSEVVEKQAALLKSAVNAVEQELRGRGFTVAETHGSVSDYDASLFATFDLRW